MPQNDWLVGLFRGLTFSPWGSLCSRLPFPSSAAPPTSPPSPLYALKNKCVVIDGGTSYCLAVGLLFCYQLIWLMIRPVLPPDNTVYLSCNCCSAAASIGDTGEGGVHYVTGYGCIMARRSVYSLWAAPLCILTLNRSPNLYQLNSGSCCDICRLSLCLHFVCSIPNPHPPRAPSL